MLESKAERPGLHSDSGGYLEDRLKANAFFADEPTTCGFRATAELTYSPNVFFGESIFVRIDDNLVRGNRKSELWTGPCRLRKFVGVVFSVLDELINESCVFRVELLGKSG